VVGFKNGGIYQAAILNTNLEFIVKREKPNTFASDLVNKTVTKVLISMSQDNILPECDIDSFPDFQVYPCRTSEVGDFTCDIAMKLGTDSESKNAFAETIIEEIDRIFAVPLFSEVVQTDGFIHFKF